jgi:hypothetical protein
MIWLLMTCMVSSRHKGTGPLFTFFSCSNFSCVYFVQVSLLLIGQQDFGHFFRYRPLLPIAGVLCKFGGTSEKFWPKSIQFCRQKLNSARETVPLKSGQVDIDIGGEGKVDFGERGGEHEWL